MGDFNWLVTLNLFILYKESVMKIAGAHVVFHRFLSTGKDKKCEKNFIQAVLLCKRTQDAPVHPGYWSLIGGVLEDREDPQDAVLREVEEELEIINYQLQAMEELRDVEIIRKDGPLLIRYFKSHLDVGMDRLRLKWNKKEKKVEGEGLGWFTAEEVHHLMMRPEDCIAVEYFFQANGV